MSREVVDQLLEKNSFEHYYQPIFNLKNDKPIGGELLLRTQYGKPEHIFKQAKRHNKLFELDTISIENAFSIASKLQEQMLFVNVFPSTIKNPLFFPFIEKVMKENQIQHDQIVFEINEAEMVRDLNSLKSGINRLREYGFLIACDDIGKGSMDITYMLELNINFIKLDRRFSNNLIKSMRKQDLISALLFYCKANQIKVILEGIENKETLYLAKKLGMDLGQGYFLGIPDKLNNIDSSSANF